jgi:hypothetical protein
VFGWPSTGVKETAPFSKGLLKYFQPPRSELDQKLMRSLSPGKLDDGDCRSCANHRPVTCSKEYSPSVDFTHFQSLPLLPANFLLTHRLLFDTLRLPPILHMTFNLPKLISRLLILFACVAGAAKLSAAEGLRIAWDKNMLTVSGPNLPGGSLQTWYLEAFCRNGSTHQEWDKTTIPHRTELISQDANGKRIQLRTTVEPSVIVDHEITAGKDEVTFRVKIQNNGKEKAGVHWFQPCSRVDKFTGKNQNDYITKSFVFTKEGLQRLSDLPRNEEAVYKGGQVYVPAGISKDDVNPRPISSITPVNGLIGCFSADEKQLFAAAWSDTQELFQGVIVCLHNDPRVGGLAAGETKELFGKMYFLPNYPKLLLRRYEKDFKKR